MRIGAGGRLPRRPRYRSACPSVGRRRSWSSRRCRSRTSPRRPASAFSMKMVRLARSCCRKRWAAVARFWTTTTTEIRTCCWSIPAAGPGTHAPLATASTCALYQNDGTGHFRDVSAETGLNVQLYGTGVAVGDYDNDGFVDVFLAAVGTNQLLHNEQGLPGCDRRHGGRWSSRPVEQQLQLAGLRQRRRSGPLRLSLYSLVARH